MTCNQDEQFTERDLRKLTKKEIIHLVFDGHIYTKAQLRNTRAQQILDGNELCYQCRFIAKKLGLEV